MLVVITIIGLIMGLVGPRVLEYLGESKVKAAKIQIESLSAALDLYYLDNGRYPGASEGLDRAGARPARRRPGTAPISRPRRAHRSLGPPLRLQGSPGDHAPYEIDSYGPAGPQGGGGRR